MTADELHALAVRTRDAARLAERHGTSTHGYRRAAREACERMGEMAEQLADAEERARLAEVDADAFQETLAKAEATIADMCRGREHLTRNIAEVQRLRNGAEVALSRAIERQGALNGDIFGARTELRALVAALGQDDGPRAAAIQHARAVLEGWGMR